MNADFHYRDRIAVAVIGQDTQMGRQIVRGLASHPWFVLADGTAPVGLTIDLSGHSEAAPRIADGIAHIVIPELNAQSINLKTAVEGLPSASSAALALALSPLHRAFGLKAVRAVLMEGPGIGPNNAGPNPSLGVRVERELKHIFPHDFTCSIDVIAVPVSEQITQCISVTLEKKADCEALKAAWESAESAITSLNLPSMPDKVIHFWDGIAEPLTMGKRASELRVHVSQLEPCPIFGCKFVVTSHIQRSGVLLLAELLVKTGKVYW